MNPLTWQNSGQLFVAQNFIKVKIYSVAELRVNLKADKFTKHDCTDGSFYRYDHKIYTSIEDIINSVGGTNPFGKDLSAIMAELKIVDGKITASADERASFRQRYNIEVFVGGICYYNTPINDEYTPTGFYSVLRNTIYQLTVKNIFNVGADVPNGKPEDLKPNYYIKVSVEVNPWILRTYDVNLD